MADALCCLLALCYPNFCVFSCHSSENFKPPSVGEEWEKNEILLHNSILLDVSDSIILPLSKVISSKNFLLQFEKLSYIAL